VIGVTVALWVASEHGGKKSLGSRLLGFLLILEVGLIPVNYGVLTANRPMERVTEIASDGESWLVWEDGSRRVFLWRPLTNPFLQLVPEERIKAASERRIIVVLEGKIERLRLSGYERLLQKFLLGKP
jgi:hypothetical protein